MDNLIGKWKAVHDVHTRMGVTAFTLPIGATVAVTQVDQTHSKVLVECDSRTMDWMPSSFLKSFEMVS